MNNIRFAKLDSRWKSMLCWEQYSPNLGKSMFLHKFKDLPISPLLRSKLFPTFFWMPHIARLI